MGGESENTAGERSPIFLVGMMGAGKSTVGPVLAARTGRVFVDTDHAVERAAGMTVAEIFDREGEAGFRARERAAIEAAGQEAAVVALGGGAIVQPGAAARLTERGTVVWLEADPETILGRIGDAATRPLLAGLDAEGQREKLDALLVERKPYYARAAIRVDATRDAEAVVDAILAAMHGR
ncbi:MAG: shikimate kinase [Myxococcota bacterium]